MEQGSQIILVTERNFCEAAYLANNQDVMKAVLSGEFSSGLEHFQRCGIHENRFQLIPGKSKISSNVAKTMTRSLFADLIEESTKNEMLEIGPLNKPMINSNRCKYFDLLDTESLKNKAVAHNLDPSTVPFIDFFHLFGDLSCINKSFDSVISAHCIEHQPDLIRHFTQVANLLGSVDSKYFVIVPDKRFCFDHFIPESSLTEIIIAYEENRIKPPKYKVIEHLALTTHNDAQRHWNGDHGFYGSNLEQQWKVASKHYDAAEGAYIDTHCWQFTPNSFFNNVDSLFRLGYIDFVCVELYPTAVNDLEFFAVLEKKR